jgi:hypothetical protein
MKTLVNYDNRGAAIWHEHTNMLGLIEVSGPYSPPESMLTDDYGTLVPITVRTLASSIADIFTAH